MVATRRKPTTQANQNSTDHCLLRITPSDASRRIRLVAPDPLLLHFCLETIVQSLERVRSLKRSQCVPEFWILLSYFLVMSYQRSELGIKKRGAASMEDECVIAQDIFVALASRSKGEVNLFSVTCPKFQFVEISDFINYASTDVHTESDSCNEFRIEI